MDVFAINGHEVYAPDEETWDDIAIGDDLDGLQKLSPYRILTWTRQVADMCDLDGSSRDWFTYKNSVLTSLTTREPGKLDVYTTYTDAVCRSVNFRARHGVGNEIVAVFWVDAG
jgi:hypothetical protein